MPRWRLTHVHSEGQQGNFQILRVDCDFPMENELRAQWLLLCRTLSQRLLRGAGPVQQNLFVQMAMLPRPGGAALLSRNASRWAPVMALGVWPHREPPRSLESRDLTHRLPGTSIPTLAYEARRLLARDPQVLREAEEQMSGSGALLQIYSVQGWAEREARAAGSWLQSGITDEVYRNFPFYVVLLDTETLEELLPAEEDLLLNGALLYVREDAEQGCAYVVARASKEDFTAALQATG